MKKLAGILLSCIWASAQAHFIEWNGLNDMDVRYDSDEDAPPSAVTLSGLSYPPFPPATIVDDTISSATGYSTHFFSAARTLFPIEITAYTGAGTGVSQHADTALFVGPARLWVYQQHRWRGHPFGSFRYISRPFRVVGNVSPGGSVFLSLEFRAHQNGCGQVGATIEVIFERSTPGAFDVTLPEQSNFRVCPASDTILSGWAFITLEMKAFDGEIGSSASSYSSISLVEGMILNNNNLVTGDVNGDGAVTVADLLLMQQALTGEISLDAEQMLRADLSPPAPDGDNVLTISDLTALEKILSMQ